jgi:hypothetical protein
MVVVTLFVSVVPAVAVPVFVVVTYSTWGTVRVELVTV